MKAKKKVVKCAFLTASGLCDCKENYGYSRFSKHKRLKMKCNHSNKLKCKYYINSPVVKDGG